MSIMFGRSAVDYEDHWKTLLQSFEADNFQEFEEKFPGFTVDWSDAERKGHAVAFVKHMHKQFRKTSFTEDDAYKFLRKCDVHFKRSRQRILQNDLVVPPKKKRDFRRLTDRLISDQTSSSEFKETALKLQKMFPLALPWLKWHLHPIRAKSYFPACVANIERFQRMSKTTNAQENLGGQFQYVFPNHQTLNVAALNMWKFANCFEQDHVASLKGLSNKYSHFPLSDHTKVTKRKRKRHENDGRGPDTTQKLRKAARNKKVGKKDLSETLKELFPDDALKKEKFRGIQWCFVYRGNSFNNTCPLDSFLTLLYVLHRGRVMIQPLAELRDSKSLLARAFKELDDNNTATGGVRSRMVFINDHYKQDWLDSTHNNLHSHLDVFFRSQGEIHPVSGVSPLLTSVLWTYNRKTPSCTLGTRCRCPKGPRHAQYSSRTRLKVKFNSVSYSVLNGMSVKAMKKIVDETFDPEVSKETVCTVDYIPTGETYEDGKPKMTSSVICNGNLKRNKAVIKKAAHLAVIDIGESQRTNNTQLYDLPFEFIHMGKRWTLRGAILGNGVHFTAVARFPTCWIFYDGMMNNKNGVKLRVHPLNRMGCKDAQEGYGIAHVYYELHEIEDKQQFGSAEFNPSTVFEYKGIIPTMAGEFYSSEGGASDEDEEKKCEWSDEQMEDSNGTRKKTEKEKQEDILSDDESEFEWSDKEMEDSDNTMDWSSIEGNKKSTRLSTKERVPEGWSLRPKGRGSHGPRPQCKGCHGKIKYANKCLRHKYTKKGHFYPTIDQFHCKIGCLENIYRQPLKVLTMKHWTDKRVAKLVKKLDKKLNLSP